MKREAGYYWILYYNQWTVAEFIVPKKSLIVKGKYNNKKVNGFWQIIGNEVDFYETDFKQIDERKIQRL